MDFKKLIIFSIIITIFLTIGAVSASENATDEISLDETSSESIQEISVEQKVETNDSSQVEEVFTQKDTKIESEDIITYYKENSQLVSYLKDTSNNPIPNKKISILINNKAYNKITDNQGKIVLKINLKPNKYQVTVKFDGDENYTASTSKVTVDVKKSALAITANDYKTYFESGFFFKAKVINKITKNPVKDVKVAFKVYTTHNKYKLYYGTTDSNGIAKLKKNLKPGSYKIIIQIKKNNYLKAKKAKATLTVKETVEMGCTSLFVQVSNTEAVVGFRRDTTNAKALHIVKYKLNKIPAVKQYKKNSYFFHIVTSANGWMAGTGGADDPSINHAIEKLVGKMFKKGKIEKSYLKKIQGYERSLGIGHFSIKAPDGKYAVVWSSGIKYGKLKPGEYFKAPNAKSFFHQGKYVKFSKNPAKAAIKIAASDSFGINRRDATALHWKATTKAGKTTAAVKAYAANDNGHLVGRSTGYLKDDIYFNGKFISKNALPKTPSSKYLGTYKLGNIDKFIKIKTVVKVSSIAFNLSNNESDVFKFTVKNKATNKAIKHLVVKVKIDGEVCSIKTNGKGVAQLKTKLPEGTHKVALYTNNIKYHVSAKIKIIIKDNCLNYSFK